jgi:hypothetical protein
MYGQRSRRTRHILNNFKIKRWTNKYFQSNKDSKELRTEQISLGFDSCYDFAKLQNFP